MTNNQSSDMKSLLCNENIFPPTLIHFKARDLGKMKLDHKFDFGISILVKFSFRHFWSTPQKYPRRTKHRDVLVDVFRLLTTSFSKKDDKILLQTPLIRNRPRPPDFTWFVSAAYRSLTKDRIENSEEKMQASAKHTLGCAMNALAAPGNSACWATVAAVFSHNVSKRASTLHYTFSALF